MMKIIVVLATVLAAAVAIPSETYDTKYDDFNAQEIVENVHLLANYGNCFNDKGPCTSEGKYFKKAIHEAIRTNCAKCTPKQRELIRIVVKALETKLPALWEELVQKYDPTGEYKESFHKFIYHSN